MTDKKKLWSEWLTILVALLMLIFVQPAHAVTINAIRLQNLGVGSNIVDDWNTDGYSWWNLGVSETANGPLVNYKNTTISNVPLGSFWLYADQTGGISGINTNTFLLSISAQDDPDCHQSIYAWFTVNGTPGSGTRWTLLHSQASGHGGGARGGYTISLGWAIGTADKVINRLQGPNTNSTGYQRDISYMVPDGTDDLYLQGYYSCSHVPIPPTVWLLGSGLLGLAGWRRFRKS